MYHRLGAVAGSVYRDSDIGIVARRHEIVDASHCINMVETGYGDKIVHRQILVVAQSLGQLMPVGVVDVYHRRAVHLGNSGRGANFGNCFLKSCHILY